jgi:hypothetical protein
MGRVAAAAATLSQLSGRKIMSYSIRHSIVNGRGYLQAAIGDARETPSGFWIVSINNQAQDVAITRDDAVTMLKAAIDQRG